MGVSVIAYIDYYVKIKPVKRKVEYSHLECSNCHKKYDKVQGFCSVCGKPVVIKTVSRDELVTSFYEMIHGIPSLEKFGDLCSHPESSDPNFYTLDTDTGGKRVDVEDGCCINASDLTAKKLSDKTQAFLDEFLTAFKATYGEDSIKLEYGFYCYYSY
jgi:hypothetical protein